MPLGLCFYVENIFTDYFWITTTTKKFIGVYIVYFILCLPHVWFHHLSANWENGQYITFMQWSIYPYMPEIYCKVPTMSENNFNFPQRGSIARVWWWYVWYCNVHFVCAHTLWNKVSKTEFLMQSDCRTAWNNVKVFKYRLLTLMWPNTKYSGFSLYCS